MAIKTGLNTNSQVVTGKGASTSMPGMSTESHQSLSNFASKFSNPSGDIRPFAGTLTNFMPEKGKGVSFGSK